MTDGGSCDAAAFAVFEVEQVLLMGVFGIF